MFTLVPALGDDGAHELSAFAKLYWKLAQGAYQGIISGIKFWF
jgi:hypothetical protein